MSVALIIQWCCKFIVCYIRHLINVSSLCPFFIVLGKLAADCTTNADIITTITTGVVIPKAPQREKTVLNVDMDTVQDSIDPNSTSNTNTAVYTSDDSYVDGMMNSVGESISTPSAVHTTSTTSRTSQPVYLEQDQIIAPKAPHPSQQHRPTTQQQHRPTTQQQHRPTTQQRSYRTKHRQPPSLQSRQPSHGELIKILFILHDIY